jgi:hypothetical protein
VREIAAIVLLIGLVSCGHDRPDTVEYVGKVLGSEVRRGSWNAIDLTEVQTDSGLFVVSYARSVRIGKNARIVCYGSECYLEVQGEKYAWRIH